MLGYARVSIVLDVSSCFCPSCMMAWFCFFFFQAEDGIRYLVRSRGLGDVYKRQVPLRERLPLCCVRDRLFEPQLDGSVVEMVGVLGLSLIHI